MLLKKLVALGLKLMFLFSVQNIQDHIYRMWKVANTPISSVAPVDKQFSSETGTKLVL